LIQGVRRSAPVETKRRYRLLRRKPSAERFAVEPIFLVLCNRGVSVRVFWVWGVFILRRRTTSHAAAWTRKPGKAGRFAQKTEPLPDLEPHRHERHTPDGRSVLSRHQTPPPSPQTRSAIESPIVAPWSSLTLSATRTPRTAGIPQARYRSGTRVTKGLPARKPRRREGAPRSGTKRGQSSCAGRPCSEMTLRPSNFAPSRRLQRNPPGSHRQRCIAETRAKKRQKRLPRVTESERVAKPGIIEQRELALLKGLPAVIGSHSNW